MPHKAHPLDNPSRVSSNVHNVSIPLHHPPHSLSQLSNFSLRLSLSLSLCSNYILSLNFAQNLREFAVVLLTRRRIPARFMEIHFFGGTWARNTSEKPRAKLPRRSRSGELFSCGFRRRATKSKREREKRNDGACQRREKEGEKGRRGWKDAGRLGLSFPWKLEHALIYSPVQMDQLMERITTPWSSRCINLPCVLLQRRQSRPIARFHPRFHPRSFRNTTISWCLVGERPSDRRLYIRLDFLVDRFELFLIIVGFSIYFVSL